MAMPCTITISDKKTKKDIRSAIKALQLRLKEIDETYSPFKKTSVISRLNRHKVNQNDLSKEVKIVLRYCQETKKLTNGYFDIKKPDGQIDPCGLIKGWAILDASNILKKLGFKNFMLEIAGDIQTSGSPENESKWAVGIRNPFDINEVVKIVYLSGEGIATSGTYMQGKHIYNPKKNQMANEIVSLTVIGPNIYEADRFATAAFAMGKSGIKFIESYPSLEGYAISHDSVATFTSSFKKYL